MADLEPITREEMLLDGQDLEPITRKEMFIKRIYDKTQVIPEPITREEIFLKKAGDETTDVTIEQLTATENRTYSEEGVAYSPVIVNVPQTTLTTLDVTENGTYTAPSGTAYNEVEVDVPLPENAYLLKDIPATPASIATFTDGSALPMPKLEVAIEPVQEGSGDPSPTNIRPISGWSAVDVTKCGKNTCPQKITEFGFSKNAGGNSSVQGDTLVITTTSSANSGVYSVLEFVKSFTGKCSYSIDIKASTNGDVLLGMSNAGRKTVSVTTDWQRVKFEDVTFDGNSKTFVIYSQGVENTIQVKDFMFELGSVAHDYEPYNGTTYTIDLGGTRYGGTLDVVSGVLTVDSLVAIYDGSNDEVWEYSAGWSKTNTSVFYLPPNPAIKFTSWDDYPYSNCNILTPMSRNEIYDADSIGISLSGSLDGGSPSIRVPKEIASVSDLRTWLSNNNIQAVYKLVTPLTYQLTPTIIKSLQGDNNFFASTGEIELLQYWGEVS